MADLYKIIEQAVKCQMEYGQAADACHDGAGNQTPDPDALTSAL